MPLQLSKSVYKRIAAQTARKYRNRPTNGYASAKEAKRAAELKLLEKAGDICDLREQVRYELIPAQKEHGVTVERACSYIADFAYVVRKDGEMLYEVVEDCKGFRTEVFKIKKKLMRHVHGIEVIEI